MSLWTSQPTCKMQGSLHCNAQFTIRVIDDPTGAAATSDFTITEGQVFDSLDDFLEQWEAAILSDISIAYTCKVNTTGGNKGKITITSAGNNFTLGWAHSGDTTEATRWQTHMGATSSTTTNTASPFTLPNAHVAGFYPALPPSKLEVTSTTYNRGYGVSLGTTSWTQADPAIAGQGNVSIDLELQIDGSTNWQELWDLGDFFDDVFDSMGEPFTVINVPADDTTGDYWTGYVADSPFEIVGERVTEGWNGLLVVPIRIDGAHTPHVESAEEEDDGGGGGSFGGG